MNIHEDKFSKEQLEVCKTLGVLPSEVSNEQMVVVSDGVFEGDPVEGVRYPSPEHMSGWWLTTDKYNGNSDTLRTEHISHLIEKRPELSKFLTLPFGFRFRTVGKEEIWFDEKVANSTP